MDKIHQLKLFCLVAQKQSFAQTATQLGLPRSTVSHAIKSLEKEYEVLLFYRTTRKVRLTHEGHLFYLEAVHLIEQLGELNRFKGQGGVKQGKIRIGLSKRLATEVLIPNLEQYYKKYPNVKILINSQDQYSNLIDQGLDCVVRVGDVQSDSLLARFIGLTELLTLASPLYIIKNGMPYIEEGLKRHHVVEYRIEKSLSHSSFLYFKHQKYAINYKILVEDTASYVCAGIAGLGMIQIPQFDAENLMATNDMILVLSQLEPCEIPIHILMTDRKYRPEYLNDFIDWLEGLLKSVVGLKQGNNPATNNQHNT